VIRASKMNLVEEFMSLDPKQRNFGLTRERFDELFRGSDGTEMILSNMIQCVQTRYQFLEKKLKRKADFLDQLKSAIAHDALKIGPVGLSKKLVVKMEGDANQPLLAGQIFEFEIKAVCNVKETGKEVTLIDLTEERKRPRQDDGEDRKSKRRKLKVATGFKFRNKTELRKAAGLWCSEKDEALKKYGHIAGWNTSLITDMSFIFSGLDEFNDDISGWDTSAVKDMSFMFFGASAFNADIGGWDVSSVTTMSHMFAWASVFNADIGGWDVSSVTTMSYTFSGASAFKADISGWQRANS